MGAASRGRSCQLRRLVFAFLTAAIVSPEVQADPSPPVKKTGAAEPLAWLRSLSDGLTESQRRRLPVMIKASSKSCAFCRQLDERILDEKVQKELKSWVLVSLDIDDSPKEARRLSIGPLPGLRLLTPAGKLVASHDGLLDADELIDWLQEHLETAAEPLPTELTDAGEPSAVDLTRILKQFQQRDAVLREAAIRRLSPWPNAAASRVATAFQDGPLATRLASLELLTIWKAPVAGLDPWRPETLTEARIKDLSEWAEQTDHKPVASDPAASLPLAADAAGEAKRQIERMLRAEPAEAAAIREQLARLGRRLLPIVRESQLRAETDAARERLTALRYRLAAAPALVLNWPGGLDRLAATQFPVRLSATDELLQRAGAADEDLLLELFSDPSPLIRELSLRGLKQIGGHQANGALARLLEDPEPNVRAAVLKQLAESPSASIVPRIVEYVAKEQDPDLLVHAVRVFREAQGEQSLEALQGLAKHNSWRVRAEAIEGIVKAIGRSSSLNESQKQSARRTLLAALQDEDGFVVGRSLEGLSETHTDEALKLLLGIPARHPELTEKVVTSLTSYGQQAIEPLRNYLKHEQPSIRATAISGLVSVAQANSQGDLKLALADPEREVRIAAADSLFSALTTAAYSQLAMEETVLEVIPAEVEAVPEEQGILGGILRSLFGGKKTAPSMRKVNPPADAEPIPPDETKPSEFDPQPKPATPETPVPTPASAEPARESESKGEVPTKKLTRGETRDEALLAIRGGNLLPKWLTESAQLLHPLLASDDPGERLAAARPLAVFGNAAASPILLESAAQPAFLARVSEMLPYVPWSERLPLFQALVGAARGPDQLETAVEGFYGSLDERIAPALWELLADDKGSARLAENVRQGLKSAWYGNSWQTVSEARERDRQRALDETAARSREGSRWQRIVAWTLRLECDRELARESARAVLEDPQADEAIRRAAFHMLLIAAPKSQATRLAVDSLSGEDAARRRLSLSYVALGPSAVGEIDGFEVAAYLTGPYGAHYSSQSTEKVAFEPPEGLSVDVLTSFLQGNDARAAAEAGYLLVMLEHPEGLPPLLTYWESSARDNAAYSALVSRAIAAVDDPQYVPLLASIFESLRKRGDTSQIGEFYWTIRSMTGPEVLKLRKQIRDEFGASFLP